MDTGNKESNQNLLANQLLHRTHTVGVAWPENFFKKKGLKTFCLCKTMTEPSGSLLHLSSLRAEDRIDNRCKRFKGDGPCVGGTHRLGQTYAVRAHAIPAIWERCCKQLMTRPFRCILFMQFHHFHFICQDYLQEVIIIDLLGHE